MKSESTFDFHIRWAWARISRLYNQQAAEYGGTMSIGYVLLNIDREGTPSTKLGPKMGMESRSLTRTLKSMEQLGLIERKADETDRRMVRVFLTEEGKRVRDISRQRVLHLNTHVLDNWGEDKTAQFIGLLQEFNELLEDEDIFEKNTSA